MKGDERGYVGAISSEGAEGEASAFGAGANAEQTAGADERTGDIQAPNRRDRVEVAHAWRILEATMTTAVDHSVFFAERERQAARLAELEAKFANDSTLGPTEISFLSSEISAVRAALAALDARIARFQLEDINRDIAELESQLPAQIAILAETNNAYTKFHAWRAEHDRAVRNLADESEIANLVRQYAEVMPLVIKNQGARRAADALHGRLDELRDKRMRLDPSSDQRRTVVPIGIKA